MKLEIEYEYESKTLTSITIKDKSESEKIKTNYYANDNFDSTNAVVEATYNSGNPVDVTDKVIWSPDRPLTTTDKIMTASYTEGGVTKEDTIEITVSARQISSIELSGDMKKNYSYGEEWDTSELKVEAKYNAGNPTDITSEVELHFTPNSPAINTKSVSVYATYLTFTSNTLNFSGITVTADTSFKLVKDASKLKEGDEIAIVGIESETYYSMDHWVSSNNNCKRSQISVSQEKITSSDGFEYFLLGTSDKGWTIKGGNTYLYASGGTSSNYLRGSDTVQTGTGEWTIDCNNAGVATIKCVDSNTTRNSIRHNISSDLFSCYASGQADIYLYSRSPVLPDQVSTSVEFTTPGQAYYNVDYYNNDKLSTNQLTVKGLDAGGNPITGKTITNGIGYSVTIYSDVECQTEIATYDATSEVKSHSFANDQMIDNETKFYLKATYNDITSDSLEITVYRKNPTEAGKLTFTVDSSTTTLVSHLDAFIIKGGLNVTFNNGSNTQATTEKFRIEVFEGSSATGTSLTDFSSYEHESYVTGKKIIDGFEIPMSVKGDLLFHQDTNKLAYSSNMTFTYRLTMLGYSMNNVVTQTIHVYQPTLVATPESGITYYTNQSYTFNPAVSVSYNNGSTRELTNGYTVNGGQPFSSPTAGTFDIEVALVIDSNVKTTFSVTIKAPSTPTDLTILFDSFKAGDEFYIDSGEITYEGGSSTEEIFSGDNRLSFVLSPTQNMEDAEAISFFEGDYLYKDYDGYYMFATVTIGEESASSEGDKLTVEDAEVSEYTPGSFDYFEKITSSSSLTNGKYLFIYESTSVALDGSLDSINAIKNTVGVTISNNKITYLDDLLTVTFEYNSDNQSFKSSKGKYLNGGAKTISLVNVPTSFTIGFTNGNVDLQASDESYLRFNKNSGQERFRFYASGQEAVQLYKLHGTEPKGDIYEYLTSYIDALRLNTNSSVTAPVGEHNLRELSSCDAQTKIYGTDEWNAAKAAFKSLTDG